jgi:hypothetical protein
MLRVLVLRFILGFVMGLAGYVTCCFLDVLLSSCMTHDRGLWEGGAVALVINGGLALENLVCRHVAKKKGKHAKFNGKPMSHWEAEAKSLVMDLLIKAVITYEPRLGAPHSIIHELASKQLLAIATGIDPRMARETREGLCRLAGGMNAVLADMLGADNDDA